MATNTTIPLRIYGLFLEGHPELSNRVPKEIIEKASYSFKPETAIAIKTKDFFKMKDILMTGLNRLDNPLMRSKRLELISMPRDEREFIGDYIQIIGAACIHDDKRIILLRPPHNLSGEALPLLILCTFFHEDDLSHDRSLLPAARSLPG